MDAIEIPLGYLLQSDLSGTPSMGSRWATNSSRIYYLLYRWIKNEQKYWSRCLRPQNEAVCPYGDVAFSLSSRDTGNH